VATTRGFTSLATGLGATLNFGPGSVLELKLAETNTSRAVSMRLQRIFQESGSGRYGLFCIVSQLDGLSSMGVTTIVKVTETGQTLPPITLHYREFKALAWTTTSADNF